MLRIHSFESMGTHDGPGIRLVVFLQGCNFRCLYCANPDTIPIGKGGKLIPIEEVLRRAINEKPFFGKRGGITFSGGEPTVQAKALIPLCKELKREGIHICLDSNGSIINPHVMELLEYVDMVLLDCKQINQSKHLNLTEVSNSNTLKMADYLQSINKPVRLRYVFVPSISDAEEDLHALGHHFSQYTNIERLELLPYHTFGKHKYETMDQEYKLNHIEEPSREHVKWAIGILEQYFDNVWWQFAED